MSLGVYFLGGLCPRGMCWGSMSKGFCPVTIQVAHSLWATSLLLWLPCLIVTCI